MVIPVDIQPQPRKGNRYVGNDLRLDLRSNNGAVTVIGNSSHVKVRENAGLLKVVGNNCHVIVERCPGRVEYVGNNGIISFGEEMQPGKVTYVGSNVVISSKKESKCKSAQMTNIPPRKGRCFDSIKRCNKTVDKTVTANYLPVEVVIPDIKLELGNIFKKFSSERFASK